MTPGNTGSALDLLLDIELPVTLRFGRTQMTLSEVMDLNRGSVIDFGQSAEEPVEVLVNGRVINPDLKDYKLQSIMEYVPITSIILENYNPDGPYGVRGCGEAPISPVAAALANAVYDAVGVRMFDLPITPEKVLLALRSKK